VKLSVSFDNLEDVRRAYDPAVVQKAAESTIRQLHSKAATAVNKQVRQVYNIKAGTISKSLTKRVVTREGIPAGYLIYLGGRLSLRHFSTVSGTGEPSSSARPKVKTRRGVRRGARVRVKKTSKSSILKKAFWGRARAGSSDGEGGWQIFQRIGLSRLKVKKLTGPSIAHMVRGPEALRAINDLVQREADEKLANNLDHFMRTRAGIR
jgi:hypothetical protein